MKALKLLAVCSAIAIISGCATKPVSSAASHPVPAERIFENYASFATPSAKKSRVVVIRDSGMLGVAGATKLSIDGIDIASLRTSERLELHLEPRAYIFGIEPVPKLGGALVENSFVIEEGKEHYFRISIAMGGQFVIQPTARIQ